MSIYVVVMVNIRIFFGHPFILSHIIASILYNSILYTVHYIIKSKFAHWIQSGAWTPKEPNSTFKILLIIKILMINHSLMKQLMMIDTAYFTQKRAA